MSITTEQIAIFWFWLAVAYIWMPPIWLLMRFLTPKHFVERYFKEPHFNKGETIFLSVFPGTLIRTGILMAACYSKRYRKGRQLKDYLDYAPHWYVIASKLFAFCAIVHGFLWMALMIGLAIYPADNEASTVFLYPFDSNFA